MSNQHSDVLSININSQANFILENLLQYKNLENLELNNIKLNNFTTIKELFDNLNFSKMKTLDCKFTVENTQIEIQIINELVHLRISTLNSPNITAFFLNLPSCINCIYIRCCTDMCDTLDTLFINLPVNLQKIEIEYSSLFNLPIYESVKKIEERGVFNCLFNAKLPFGCKIILYIQYLHTILYALDVVYENNEDNELTVSYSNSINLKTNKIIIKYISFVVYSFSTGYNVLKIMSGLGGIAFTS